MSPILNDPLRNKGTAFTQEERDRYHLNGLLPYQVSTLEEQVVRRYQNFKAQPSDLAKYLFLSGIQNRNETLFYRLVHDHISEMLPLIYTPTVGDVSLQYSYLYTQPRGLYFSYPLQDKIETILDHYPVRDIDVVVVTDGERILGLGDLGAGGMAIPVGKLSLYTVFGGIYPGRTLPIMLDVGTNNASLVNDPLYIGWRHPRINGKEYDVFIDRFVKALKKKYPHVLLQWEDFGGAHAHPLLERYKDTVCSFNDDIQGTAAVTLAAVLTAIKKNHTQLHEQRIVVFGGGSAGMGICHHFLGAMEAAGISKDVAKEAFYVIDRNGLVHTGLAEVPSHQRPFARDKHEISSWNGTDLIDVIQAVRPTVLIGVSAQSGAFKEAAIRAMVKYVDQPIIFPLSNPTSKCEAHPADLMEWTKGKAIIATGSPFEGFAQCNNVYIFPGVGLGVIASKAKRVSDKMFYKAAEILSENSPMLHTPLGTLFPPFENLRAVSQKIGVGVAEVAMQEGLAPPGDPRQLVDATMWFPNYEGRPYNQARS